MRGDAVDETVLDGGIDDGDPVAPGEALGRYELGDDVAVEPDTGGAISAPDYALGVVDLIEDRTRSRVQVNLGNPA